MTMSRTRPRTRLKKRLAIMIPPALATFGFEGGRLTTAFSEVLTSGNGTLCRETGAGDWGLGTWDLGFGFWVLGLGHGEMGDGDGEGSWGLSRSISNYPRASRPRSKWSF